MNRSQLNEEFNQRIKHNFREFVLLTSNTIQWSEYDVLQFIYKMKGYRRHKSVKYGPYVSHIHIKYEDEKSAREAVDVFNVMNFTGLTASLVDYVLREWFAYERFLLTPKFFTLSVVDVIGYSPFNLNLLKAAILTPIFEYFGKPNLAFFHTAIEQPHVQLLFNSMTEAFAACIFFGEWYRYEEKTDCVSYRVRINPSNVEETLIINFGGYPQEAYKLEYFLTYLNSTEE